MLNYFKEKKETFFDLTKMKFFKFLKNALLNFWPKNAIFFSSYRFDQNKTRNNTF